MRNNRMKRWIGTLLALCLVVGSLLPTAAFAAGTDTGKAIQLVDSGTAANISGGQTNSVYFGTYQQSGAGNTQPTGTENVDWIKNDEANHRKQGPYYSIDPIKWRVLGNAGGKLFLLSDQNLDVFKYHEKTERVTWETSTMRSWLNGYSASANIGGGEGIDYTSDNFLDNAFSAKERTAIADTEVVNDDNPDYQTEGGNNTTDKIFLLSIAETQNNSYFTDKSSRIATNTAYVANGGKIGTSGMYESYDIWWLRSPGYDGYRAAIMRLDGTVFSESFATNTSYTVRPAFHLNLNSVLFTSAATGGKGGTGMDSGLTAVGTAGTEWKLTLLDNAPGSGRENFDVTTTTVSTPVAGGDVEVSYSGAKTGTNEYLSAMIVDNSGAVLYYGRLKNLGTGGESGTQRITIPALADGKYTLKVFNEEYNGDHMTDYASDVKDNEEYNGDHMTDYASDVKDVDLIVGSGIFNYTISFNANGGSGTMHEQTVEEGNSVSLSANAFTRTGYTFDGWNTDADGSGTAYTDGQSITPTSSMPLHAQWRPIEYAITYHLDGGVNAAANPAIYTIETDTISLVNPTKSGSIFGGWFDNDGFNGTAVTEIAQGSTGNKELWAKWGTECIVTFDVNGGEWKDTTPATFSVVQGDMITKPADPVRTSDVNASYRFDGWYTDNNTFANEYNFSTPVSGNLTLYARWVEQHTASVTITGQNGASYSTIKAEFIALGGKTTPIQESEMTSSDSNGTAIYTFNATLDAGQYNLVVTATESTSNKEVKVTELEDLRTANDNAELTLPLVGQNSEVDNTVAGAFHAIVGHVDKVAEKFKAQYLNVDITITAKPAATNDSAPGAAEIRAIANDGASIDFVDLSLTLEVAGEADANDIGSENNICIPFMFEYDTSRENIIAYRYHGSRAEQLPKLTANPASEKAPTSREGYYVGDGFVVINAYKFSTYAIAYGGSSGGGTNPDPGTSGGYSDYDPAPSGTPPVIVDPANDWGVIAYAGKTASMGITAFGANSYQWYVDRGDGNGFVPIPGATGPSYTTSPVTMDNDGYVYRCVAMNAYGQATSPSITLNVFDYLSIPETGDNSQTGLYIGLVMIGLAGMGFSALLLRRRKS